MRAIALLSAWKFRNSLRSLFSDPRKLVPFILMIVVFGIPVSMIPVLRQSHDELMTRMRTTRQQLAEEAKKEAAEAAKAKPKPGETTQKYKKLYIPQFNPVDTEVDEATFTAALTLGTIMLALGIIGVGLGDRLLALSPSDVDYLFPAPIPRWVILAYRLPALWFASIGTGLYLLFFLGISTMVSEPKMSNPGHTVSPWWVNPAALILAQAIYFNLAMYISIRFNNRKSFQKALWVLVIGLGGSFAYIAWQGGMESAEAMLKAPILHWAFLPSSFASESILDAYSQRPAGAPLLFLFLGYLVSLLPMFMSKANWYEESIASTDKFAALKQAAKGGWAGVMAAKAATSKFKAKRLYTVTPFGQGAVALFWAHLCAAAKKPLPNFGVPFGAGLVIGIGGADIFASVSEKMKAIPHGHQSFNPGQPFGYTIIGLMVFYCWQGFMTTSRAASEASIRRRELTGPLPFPGWKSVAADLGVPILAVFICFTTAALTYCLADGPHWPVVAFAFLFLITVRLAGRIILQHIVVIAYPDLADKIQRLVSMFVFALVSSPFFFVEGIVCIPGLILRSVWSVLIPLAIIQIPMLILFLFLAGKASEKAIATGEPVRILSLIKR